MRRDEVILQDIAVAREDILSFIDGMDEPAFYSDIRTQAAVQHRFLVIGEAAKRLSQELRANHPGIQWKDAAGMRDRLVHAYEAVDLGIVWDAARNAIPCMLAAIEPMLPGPSA